MSKEIYHLNKQPPSWALKEIIGGRLKGKTDINPQWRYETLNDTFGLIGFGWKYVITKQWLEKGFGDEVVAFVNIQLSVNIDGKWSEPIEGTGGSMFIANESKGVHTSDEAFKMATTDALSVACKMLGIGAAIYSGSKYPTTKPDSKPEIKKPELPKRSAKKELADLLEANGINTANFRTWARSNLYPSPISEEDAENIIKQFNDIKDVIKNMGVK